MATGLPVLTAHVVVDATCFYDWHVTSESLGIVQRTLTYGPGRTPGTRPGGHSDSQSADLSCTHRGGLIALVVAVLLTRPDSSSPGADAPQGSLENLVRPDSPRMTDGDQVQLVEFLDFECEACIALYPHVEDIKDRYGDRVEFVVRYMPLHVSSVNAALAAEAAGRGYSRRHLRPLAHLGEPVSDRRVVPVLHGRVGGRHPTVRDRHPTKPAPAARPDRLTTGLYGHVGPRLPDSSPGRLVPPGRRVERGALLGLLDHTPRLIEVLPHVRHVDVHARRGQRVLRAADLTPELVDAATEALLMSHRKFSETRLEAMRFTGFESEDDGASLASQGPWGTAQKRPLLGGPYRKGVETLVAMV